MYSILNLDFFLCRLKESLEKLMKPFWTLRRSEGCCVHLISCIIIDSDATTITCLMNFTGSLY